MSDTDDFLDELVTEGTARDPEFATHVDDALRRREAAGTESAATQSVDEIVAEQGGRMLTSEEFGTAFRHLPSDGEG